MANSADPDQLASEANWSGSALFAKGSAGLELVRIMPILLSSTVFTQVLLRQVNLSIVDPDQLFPAKSSYSLHPIKLKLHKYLMMWSSTYYF